MIFDVLRKQNAEQYTTHPLLSMPEDEIEKLARQAGFDDIEAFKMFCFQPSDDMTCPLCGRPQNHLSDCKGCGRGAFTNWDFTEAHGEQAAGVLRERLREVLSTAYSSEKIRTLPSHVYDCMVCAECWQTTIQSPDAFRTCPLRLLADRTLIGNLAETLLMSANVWTLNRENIAGSLRQWEQTLRERWLNAVSEDVAAWRRRVFDAALNSEPQPGDRERADVSERVQECLDFLEIDEA